MALHFTSSGLNASKWGVNSYGVSYSIRALIGVGYNGSDELINLGQDTTRLVVGRYQYSASDVEQFDLWVDPDTAFEPQPGGSSSSNHIVHSRQLDSEPDRIDSVLLNDRSFGSIAFDELRVGTSWTDVISRALDKASIDRIEAGSNGIALELSRLTPGATTTVERATSLATPQSWSNVDTFVAWARSTNRVKIPAPGAVGFYRVRTE